MLDCVDVARLTGTTCAVELHDMAGRAAGCARDLRLGVGVQQLPAPWAGAPPRLRFEHPT
jgi:hypothetical protein